VIRRLATLQPAHPRPGATRAWTASRNSPRATAIALRCVAGMALAVALASPARALEIALANDDGWDAPGIQALKDALRAAGHHVTLAGPLTNQSGGSAALDHGNLCVRKQAADEFSVAVTDDKDCDGPVTTSARAATSGLVAIGLVREAGREPDLLVSGINAGANIGAFTEISGTVGAAILAASPAYEGAVPAIAISTDEPDSCGRDAACRRAHYDVVARFVVRLIAQLAKHPGLLAHESRLLPPGVALNVNYPATDSPRGVRAAVQGHNAAIPGRDVVVTARCRESCVALPVGSAGIASRGYETTSSSDAPDSDVALFAQGYVTVVPITADYTVRKARKYDSTLKGLSP
jgi:5'-nucleotidase